MKYYAVKEGKTTGVFTTWDECREQVLGYPGAVYKSFKTLADAQAFVNGETPEPAKKETKTKSLKDLVEKLAAENAIDPETTDIAFTDGSYDPETGRGGAGLVYVSLKDNTVKLEHCGISPEDTPDVAKGRNIVGELFAAETAAHIADKAGRNLVICHDYTGVKFFANGEWSPKFPVAKGYKTIMTDRMSRIGIRFIKIAAHTGNIGNEMADGLAKQGTMLKGPGMTAKPLADFA